MDLFFSDFSADRTSQAAQSNQLNNVCFVARLKLAI
jgi:hypothetical protein